MRLSARLAPGPASSPSRATESSPAGGAGRRRGFRALAAMAGLAALALGALAPAPAMAQTASTVTLTPSYLGLGTGDATFCIGLTPPAGETFSSDEQEDLNNGVSVTNGSVALLPHCLVLEGQVGGGVLGIAIDPGAGVDTVTIALPADTVATDASTTDAPEYFAAAPLSVSVALDANMVTAAAEAATIVPGPPPTLTVAAFDKTQLNLLWLPPTGDGIGLITGYELEVSETGTGGWTGLGGTRPSSPRTYQHSGLTTGTTRYYRVRAVNAIGAGAWSAVESATTEQDRILSIAAGDSPVTEGTAATFTLDIDPKPTASSTFHVYTVTYTVAESGNMVASTNEGTGKSITFGWDTDELCYYVSRGTCAPSANVVSVPTETDTTSESNSVVTVTMTAVTAVEGATAILAATTAAAVTVEDDDEAVAAPVMSIAAGASPVDEGTAATFTLDIAPKRNSSTTYTVTYSVAESGGDMVAATNEGTGKTITFGWYKDGMCYFSAPIKGNNTCDDSVRVLSIPTVTDTADEPHSVVTVTLTSFSEVPNSGSFSVPATLASPASAMVTVQDDDEAMGPGAPENLAAVPADGAVTLSWDPPSVAPDPPIARYEYRYKVGAADYASPEMWTTVSGGATARSVEVTGLTNDTEHTFEVRAVNTAMPEVVGTAASVTATPAVPATVTIVAVVPANDQDRTEGDAAVFDLTRTGSAARALTVTVTVSESGEMVAASNKGQKTVMFAQNSSTATHSVPTETDTTSE